MYILNIRTARMNILACMQRKTLRIEHNGGPRDCGSNVVACISSEHEQWRSEMDNSQAFTIPSVSRGKAHSGECNDILCRLFASIMPLSTEPPVVFCSHFLGLESACSAAVHALVSLRRGYCIFYDFLHSVSGFWQPSLWSRSKIIDITFWLWCSRMPSILPSYFLKMEQNTWKSKPASTSPKPLWTEELAAYCTCKPWFRSVGRSSVYSSWISQAYE